LLVRLLLTLYWEMPTEMEIFVGKVTVNVILGDANGDGNITAFDAVVILQIVAGMLTPSETQMISSNVKW